MNDKFIVIPVSYTVVKTIIKCVCQETRVPVHTLGDMLSLHGLKGHKEQFIIEMYGTLSA